jgi:hypothetical protein
MPLSISVQRSLIKERSLQSDDMIPLRMLEERGQYAGRPVTYFRVFDPTNAKWAGVELRRYDSLDARRILHSGHVERDGQIVLNRQVSET